MRREGTRYPSISAVRTIFVLISGALLVPKFFLYLCPLSYNETSNPAQLILGLDNIESIKKTAFFDANNKPYRVALITNQHGKDQTGKRNIDLLLDHGIAVKYIVAPDRTVKTKKMSAQSIDDKTGIKMLPWHNVHSEKEIRNYIDDIDVLAFDVQDSGMRYGYASLLQEALEVGKTFRKKIIVFDRPNLLGNYMEGLFTSAQDEPLLSLPLRYGMTFGELAYFFNKNKYNSCVDLCVVPMENYCRATQYPLTSDHISANIPSLASCHGYSFLGLLGEIRPFDVGIGTAKSFQCLALPESINFSKQKWYHLKTLLKKHGVESRYYRYFSKRKKQYCAGLTLCIQDINKVASFTVFLDLIEFFKNEGVKIHASKQLDGLVGTSRIRDFVAGKISRVQVDLDAHNQLRTFFHQASSSFIYVPLPKVAYA